MMRNRILILPAVLAIGVALLAFTNTPSPDYRVDTIVYFNTGQPLETVLESTEPPAEWETLRALFYEEGLSQEAAERAVPDTPESFRKGLGKHWLFRFNVHWIPGTESFEMYMRCDRPGYVSKWMTELVGVVNETDMEQRRETGQRQLDLLQHLMDRAQGKMDSIQGVLDQPRSADLKIDSYRVFMKKRTAESHFLYFQQKQQELQGELSNIRARFKIIDGPKEIF